MHILKNIAPSILLIILLVIVYLVYSPGLTGGFLFDDYPNLQDMGDYGGIKDWESFKSFVFNGHSGPLGRPVSLASFLLDYNSWPSKAEWFKATNLKIHLICGLLLCWLVLHLMRLFGRTEKCAVWIALLSSAIWLLHPFLLSTTFYVVQRMAQLATLFMFAGLAGYLYGRLLLVQGRGLAAYFWMTISLTLGTFLAVFSKENGILLPLLAWVIEICISHKIKPDRRWQWVFLGLPTVVIVAYLGSRVNLSDNPWPNRAFNQPERLLSEARIFWEYVYYLFVPQIEGKGLFQDGFNISRGLLDPPTTLLSVLALFALFALGVLSRKKYPLLAVAILFFMASHLIESTLLSLELYFEHRNYPGAGLIFLPLAAFLVESTRLGNSSKSLIAGAIIVVLSFLTYQRAILWSNSLELEKYWALSSPESPRAQNKLIAIYLQQGELKKAFSLAEASMQRFSHSSLISSNYFLMHINYSLADEAMFHEMANIFVRQPFDAQSIMGLRNLVDAVIKHPQKARYIPLMIEFLSRLQESEMAGKYQFKKIYFYSVARLYLALDDYDQAFKFFSKAIDIHNDMDAAMSMVAIMANASRPVEATMLLYQVEQLIDDKSKKVYLARSRDTYKFEIKRIKEILKQDLENIGISEIVIDGKSEKK